jgi:hypothetical protein
MGNGLWAMGYGLWVMGYGLWAMSYGLWAMGYGLWIIAVLLLSLDKIQNPCFFVLNQKSAFLVSIQK